MGSSSTVRPAGMREERGTSDTGHAIARAAEVTSGVSAIIVDLSEDVQSITPAKLYALSAALDDVTDLLDGIS